MSEKKVYGGAQWITGPLGIFQFRRPLQRPKVDMKKRKDEEKECESCVSVSDLVQSTPEDLGVDRDGKIKMIGLKALHEAGEISDDELQKELSKLYPKREEVPTSDCPPCERIVQRILKKSKK